MTRQKTIAGGAVTGVVVCVLALAASLCHAQGLTTVEDAKGITVTIDGSFRILIDKQRGFGSRLYDLKSAPDYNLSAGYSGFGILWVSISPTERGTLGNQYYANPIDKIDLLESSRARVRLRLSGRHAAWGQGRRLPGVRFEEDFTIYPSAHVYGQYRLYVEDQPISLYYLSMGPVTTGYWGPKGLDQVQSAGEFGPRRFSGPTASSFILQWSEGPDYFTDVLLAFYKGRYNSGNAWNFCENRLLECATNVDMTELLPKNPIPAGTVTSVDFMIRLADDMNGHEKANVCAMDYRSPDSLDVRAGRLVRNDPGDADGDGFSELEGCYVLECDPRGAEFILHGAGASRVSPAFKLLHWQGEAPKAIALDGATLASGRDFVASAANGVLLLQVLKTFMTDARIVIRQDIAPAEAAVEPQAVRKPAPGDVRAAGDDPAKDAGPVEVSDIVEKLVFDAAAKLTASAADAQPRPGVFRGCRVALTKDSPFGAGRQALRIDILRDTWQMEIKPVPPELDVWEKYDYLTFEVHNAERDMGDLVWRIEGPGVTGRNNVWHKEMLLRPGGNRIEIQLTGAPVDWSKAVSSWEFSQFQMSTSVGATLYLRNLALEKGDPRARRRKGVNVVHIESSDTFQRFGKVQAAEPGGGPPAK